MYSKGLTVYFMEKCDIIASVYEKGEHRKVYECKRLNDVLSIKRRRFNGY